MLFTEVLVDSCRKSLGGVGVGGIPGEGVGSARCDRKNLLAGGGVYKSSHAAEQPCNVRRRDSADYWDAIRRVREIPGPFFLGNRLPRCSGRFGIGSVLVDRKSVV